MGVNEVYCTVYRSVGYSHEGQTSETQTGTKSQPMLNMNINKFTDGGNYVHDAETIWLE